MFARASRNSARELRSLGRAPQVNESEADVSEDSSGDVAHLKKLGLKPGASWADIEEAYASLVSDLTPSPAADHGKVPLARKLLEEVHAAFEALHERQPKNTVA